MLDLLQFVWLLALTGYVGYRRVSASRVVGAVRRSRLDPARVARLRDTRAALSGLLEQMETGTPEERLEAARAVIRRRAAAREAS